MFADNTLTPKEAVRLCALGTLAIEPMRYSALANAVRHFLSHVLGPSLDVMGQSIELLRYEGLIDARNGAGMEDDAHLVITDEGRNELHSLLTARIRTGQTELNKLIVALKFRFLHLLSSEDQSSQIDLLVEFHENELARLTNLRVYHAEDEGFLKPWLDHDLSLVEARLAWLRDLRERL